MGRGARFLANGLLCLGLAASLHSKAEGRQGRRGPPPKPPKKHYPHYDACQDMEEQPFEAKPPSAAPAPPEEKDTEAGFCGPACQRFFSPFSLFQKAGKLAKEKAPPSQAKHAFQDGAKALKEKAFEEKLKSRVSAALEAKIFELRAARACVCLQSPKLKGCGAAAERNKLLALFESQSGPAETVESQPLDIKAACRKKREKLEEKTARFWPEMRQSLALSSPAIREGRLISKPETWLDPSPAHKMSGFGPIERLSGQALEKTKSRAIQALVEAYEEEEKGGAAAPLPPFSKKQLRAALKEGKPLHFMARRPLSPRNRQRLRKALEDLWRSSEERYFEILHQAPLLGWMKSGRPDELPEALSSAQQSLERLIKEHAEAPGGLSLFHISFKPIVEELLSEDKSYCLAAERARLALIERKSSKDNLILAASVAAAAPCFVPSPWSIAACVALEGGVAAHDYMAADTALKKSLGRSLVGKDLQDLSQMKKENKDRAMALLFAPLIFLEAGALMKTGKALTNRLRKAEPSDESAEKDGEK